MKNIDVIQGSLNEAQKKDFKKVSGAADSFEEIFVRQLLNDMTKNTYSLSEGTNKESMKIYNDMFNAEVAKTMSGYDSGFGVSRTLQETWIRKNINQELWKSQKNEK